MRLASIKYAHPDTDKYSFQILKYAAILSLVCFPANVYAQDAIGQAMCNVVMFMVGTTGKAICTVNIIALGVGALLGKLTWSRTMSCIVGVGLIFGAVGVVSDLSYNNSNSLFSSSGQGGAGSGGSGGIGSDGNGGGMTSGCLRMLLTLVLILGASPTGHWFQSKLCLN
jgi:type IV secretory pathway VirB2 component (pilin)